MLVQKLKLLKGDLKCWNREVFGRLEGQRQAVVSLLSSWDELEAEGGLSLDDVARKEAARQDYVRISCLEEVSFRQRSRCLWLKDGDRNTKFFHQVANAHRQMNLISRMRVNGRELVNEEEIKGGIVDFYQNLFLSQEREWRPGLEGVHFDMILAENRVALEQAITEEEIFWALRP